MKSLRSPRARRKRTLLVMLLLLLTGGALVNVAVTWGLALRPHDRYRYQHFERSGFPDTGIYISRGEIRFLQFNGSSSTWWAPPLPEYVDEPTYRRLVPSWSAFQNSEPAMKAYEQGEGNDLVTYTECSFGWPNIALQYTSVTRVGGSPVTFSEVSTALHLPASIVNWLEQGKFRTELPARPNWPAFAINTVFYAAILAGGWGVFAAPFALRRRRRIKRGLCPACAYPVGDNPVCTECGRPVKPTRDVPA